MPYERVVFSNHANERLFQRGFRRGDVERALRTGEVIRRYPEDEPYPSYLILAWTGEENPQPIHVVAADDDETRTTFVITLYEPDPDIWTDDFRRKQNDR